jgi:hypothetical protein
MKTHTLQAIVQSFNAASNDATRYHLNCVKLTAKDSRVFIAACDGHILSDFSVEDEDTAKLIGNRTYAVAPDSLPGLKILLKAYRLIDAHCESGPSDRLVIGKPEFGCTIEVKTAKESGIDFPDFDSVKPKNYLVEPTQISFNPDLLMDLVKAIREDKRFSVTLIVKDKLSPILLKCGDREGVLMPIRADHKTYCETPEAVEESA